MSERKKARKLEKSGSMATKEPVTKEQKAVAHWLRRNVPTKMTKFLHSHKVVYFVASKAVDALLNDSPYSVEKAKEGSSPIFETREQCVDYLDELLKQKMFHRAKKITVEKQSKKKKKDDNKTDTEKEDEKTDKEQSKKGEKKKRKIRLDMHLEQIFIDGSDAYVWLYDPIPWYYWVFGSCIVLGIIAVCLFPLWPPIMRKGVHYLSIAAAGFLVFIIALAILKYILFGILYALSGGKLKFWIFPNLTEDVGFFESFVPLYDYTYTGESKKKKKAKDSDDEEEDDEDEEEEEDNSKKQDEAEHADHSESDDSTSKRSSTEKDFEIVEKSEDQ